MSEFTNDPPKVPMAAAASSDDMARAKARLTVPLERLKEQNLAREAEQGQRRLAEAVCTIQRAYRRYRLSKNIEFLRETEPWLFSWTGMVGSVGLVQDRLADCSFVDRLAEVIFLMGGKRDSSVCHAKMILVAYMLNCDKAAIDESLRQRIQHLGTVFTRVCERPACWFRRIAFLEGYNSFYQTYVNVRYKGIAAVVPELLDKMADSVSVWHKINDCVKLGKIRSDRCQSALLRMHGRTQAMLSTLTTLLGSESRARKLLQFEITKRTFLEKLNALYSQNDGKSSSSRGATLAQHFRCIALQLRYNPDHKVVHVNSRENKYDCIKSQQSVMRCMHQKLFGLKELIHANLDFGPQMAWIPEFVLYVRRNLIVLDKAIETDDDCIAQQCSLNCYDPRLLIHHVVAEMDAAVTAATPGDTIREIKALVSVTRQSDFVLSEVLLNRVLDALDDLRMEYMDRYFHFNRDRLVTLSCKREFNCFIRDLQTHKIGFKNLLFWALSSSKSCKCLVRTPEGVTKGSKEWRMNRMMAYYSTMIATLPSSKNLDAMPETFKNLRLSVLRTMLLVRDTIIGFTVLQFAIGLSNDCSKVVRLKSHVLSILRDDAKLSQSEIVSALFAVVLQERPCMPLSEQQLLRGIFCRLIRKPVYQYVDLDPVPRLALLRIRLAIQHRMLNVAGDPPHLAHFETELSEIADQAVRLWSTSYEAYKPIYDTLINFDELWEAASACIATCEKILINDN
ncbi:hypothetical protein TRVA0_012S01486 [Trichomonascus vanleenenianus]|uniref:uncharacterized protein n=1 Tax=Trichomonascus vanleenenianus TaxID=2268995 RepID=UPI003ECB3492